MKKISLALCFALLLVAMLALGVFAAQYNSIEDKADDYRNDGTNKVTTDYLYDNDYNTAASCENNAGWINFHFIYNEGQTVSKVVIVVNSTGKVLDKNEEGGVDVIKEYTSVSTLDNIFCRVYNANGLVQEYANQKTSAAEERVGEDGKIYYVMTFDFYQTGITKVEVAMLGRSADLGIWEVEIYDYVCTEAADHAWDVVTCEEETTKTCKYCGVTSNGHVYADATCVAPMTCVLCKEATTGDVDADAHTWLEANCSYPKRCALCTLTEGEAVGEHDWVNATCVRAKHCTICDVEEGVALPHEPTSVEDGNCTTAIYCGVCKNAIVPSLKHRFAEGSTKCINEGCTFAGTNIASDATATDSWLRPYTNPIYLTDGNYFTGCGGNQSAYWIYYTFTFEEAKNVKEIFIVTNSSGTYPGDTGAFSWDEMKTDTRRIVINVWDADDNKTSVTVGKYDLTKCVLYTDANGKTYVGYTMNLNYKNIKKVQIDVNCEWWDNSSGIWEVEIWEHTECFYDTFVEHASYPDCDDVGYDTYKCACGKTTSVEVAALGHAWDAGDETKAPTETEEGIMFHTCTVCNATKEEKIPTLAHVHKYTEFTGTVITAPGCATEGVGIYACECGTATAEGVIAPTNNHKFTEYVSTITDSTAFVEGVALHKCADCEATGEVAIPRKSYNFAIYADGATSATGFWTELPSALIDGNYNIGSATTYGYGSETFTITFSENYRFDKLVFIVNSVGRCPTDGAFYHTEKSDKAYNFQYAIYNASGKSVAGDSLKTANAVEMTGVDANGNEFKYDAIVVELEESVIGNSLSITISCQWDSSKMLWEVETWGVSVDLHTEHNFVETVIKNPTCIANGTGILRCDSCDATEGEEYEIAATGNHFHSVSIRVDEATCTTKGINYLQCADCHESVQKKEIANALGHDMTGETTCTTAPYCTRCDYAEEALGHSYEVDSYEPATCAAKGWNEYVCANCGDTYTEEIDIDANAHSMWGEEVASLDPTCQTDGYWKYICMYCGNEVTETYPASEDNHNWDWDNYVYVAPTCKTAGYETKTCLTCGTTSTEEYPASEYAHKEDDGVAIEGGYRYTCELCGAVREEITIGTVMDPIVAVTGSNTVVYYATGLNYVVYAIEVGADSIITVTVDENAGVFVGAPIYFMMAGETFQTGLPSYSTEFEQAGTCCIFISLDEAKYTVPETFELSVDAKVYTQLSVGTNTVEIEEAYEDYTYIFATAGEYKLTVGAGMFVTIGSDNYEAGDVIELNLAEDETVKIRISAQNVGETSIVIEEVNKHEHSYIAGTPVAPTCKDYGYTLYTCSCGDNYESDFIGATGEHNYVEIERVEATKLADGYIITKCSNCDDEKKEIIPQLEPVVYPVKNWSEFSTAYGKCTDGDIIRLTDSFSTSQVKIEKNITIDLNGCTITTTSDYGGVLLYKGSIISSSSAKGTLLHKGKTCAIKVFGVVPKIENITITLQRDEENLMLGGIVLQSSNSNGRKIYVGSIKDVIINGEDLSNGIETYKCGDQVDEEGNFVAVIGGIENVTINSRQYGMWISANVGDIKNSTVHGDEAGIKFEGRGNGWAASANLINTTVDGNNAAVTVVYNGGEFSVIGDKYSTFTSESGVMFENAPVASENVTFNMVGVTVNADGTLTFCPHTNVSEGDCDTMAECLACTKVIGYVHTFEETSRVESTCTVAGTAYYACACGATKEVTLPYADHSYDNVVVTAPTCTAEGYTTYTCVCGDKYTGNRVPVIAHTYTPSVTPATCTEAGKTVYTCACGDTYEETIPALEHNYVYAEGAFTCTKCGDSYTCEHAWGEPEAKGATCTTAAYTKYTCSKCLDTRTEFDTNAPALGHKYDYNTKKCVRDCGYEYKVLEVADWVSLYKAVNGKTEVDFEVVRLTAPVTVKGGHTNNNAYDLFIYVKAPIIIDLNGQSITTTGDYDGNAPLMMQNAESSLVNGTINRTGGGRQLLRLDSVKLVEKVVLNNTSGSAGVTGIIINGGPIGTLRDVQIINANNHGIEAQNNGCVIDLMDNVRVTSNGQAITLAAKVNKITGCTFDGKNIGLSITKLIGDIYLENTKVIGGGLAIRIDGVAASEGNTASFSYDSASTISTSGIAFYVSDAVKKNEYCTVGAIDTAVALVNGVVYNDLDKAVAALKASTADVTTFALINDLVVDKAIVIDKKVNFSLGGGAFMVPKPGFNTGDTITVDGYTITCPEDTNGDGIFRVVEGGVLTLSGKGTVNSVGNNEYSIAIWADGGKVIINEGTYTNVGAGDSDHYDLIYVKNGGSVEINGGTFKAQTPKWTLNINDSNGGTIVVNAGKFYGYNPAESGTEPGGVCSFAADGTCITLVDGYYVVAKAHTYDAVVTAPTCTADGYTTYTCSVCGYTYTGDTVDALGHTAGETVVENNVAPDCDTVGSYDNVVYCTVCEGEISRTHETVDALGHTAGETVVENNVAPSCTTAGSYDNVVYCTVCEAEISRTPVSVDALGHKYVAGEPAADGSVTYTCENGCGASYVVNNSKISGTYYIESMDMFNATFNNGTLTIVDNALGLSGTYAYEYVVGTYTVTVEGQSFSFALDKGGNVAALTLASGRQFGLAKYIAPVTIVLGENVIKIADVMAGQPVIFVADKAGKYTITGDSNFIALINNGGFLDLFEIPEVIELAEGETFAFVAGTTSWETNTVVITVADAHVCSYVETSRTESTCTTAGSVTYTCTCGESYTEELKLAAHDSNVEIPAVLPSPKNEHTAKTAGAKCSVCGEVTVEPQNIAVTMTSDYNVFGIGSMTLSLRENIGINYKVNVPSKYTNVYIVFFYEDQYFEVVDYKLDSSTVYSFNFGETRPHKMEKNVAAYVYGETAEGYTMDIVAEYSVLKYCTNQFKKNPNKKDLLTLVSDVLVYGASVQKYVYGNNITDADLVTSKVEALGYTLTPTEFTGIESGNSIVYDDIAPLEYRWTKVSLMYGSSTELYYRFKAPTIEGLKIKVEYSDQTVYYTEEDIVDEGNGVYRISVDCLTSMQYIYDVKATFVINGVEASSVTDSINSFLYRNVTKTTGSAQDVLKALYVYGESVRAYFYNK